ncbi:acyl-CoA dehydrogenase family protein [Bradyrhizobium sp. 1]|uniref:acyl-CoA dehydrogenase family protein n=1 Tax=Bradyrhizobium sp. 1 TaxID=241591 RepID=UPI001FF88A0D|nr:acyl-CoA dehydrogenase family protein [Bradyrhizobium sp. 1]MCK1394460.1 acyl-CoA dehydrogenase family protein [Bradyrhizobium sp. 1]
MNLLSKPELLEFRAEVRGFLSENLPAELSDRASCHAHLSREDIVAWHKILYRRGWSAPSWPKEFGGPGWSGAQRYIFEEECAAADAPVLSPFGITMVGPVIYTFGTPAQKQAFLPKIVSMDHVWCQGFSEPGSGSDLASLSTRAVSDGDDYVVNGTKIWTSEAHYSDWIFCLVRTDQGAKPQSGITFLLIDLRTPGISVRPIISIDGGHSLNQVFFEDVRVPKGNRIGEENRGWTYAKFLLSYERILTADAARSKRRLARLKEIASSFATGWLLTEAPCVAKRIAALEIEVMALESLTIDTLLKDERGEALAVEPSILKLRGSEVLQRILELTCDVLGPDALAYEHRVLPKGNAAFPTYAAGRVEEYLYRRAATIYGGSSEVQHNIIAKAIFG